MGDVEQQALDRRASSQEFGELRRQIGTDRVSAEIEVLDGSVAVDKDVDQYGVRRHARVGVDQVDNADRPVDAKHLGYGMDAVVADRVSHEPQPANGVVV